MKKGLSKITPKSLEAKKASGQDLSLVYYIIDGYHKHVLGEKESFSEDFYPHKKISGMINHDMRLVYDGPSPIATFTLCDSLLGSGVEYWDNQAALYIEGLAILPQRINEGIECSLHKIIEKLALEKGNSILRAVTIDRLADFYTKNGFEVVKTESEPKEGKYNLVLLEKRLEEK